MGRAHARGSARATTRTMRAMQTIQTRGWTTRRPSTTTTTTTVEKAPMPRIGKISQPATPGVRATARASTRARAGNDRGDGSVRGDGKGWRRTISSFAGVGDSFDEFKGLFSLPKRQANDGQREGGLGLALGHDHDDDEISVHKKDMMKVFLPVALVGYLVNVVRKCETRRVGFIVQAR